MRAIAEKQRKPDMAMAVSVTSSRAPPPPALGANVGAPSTWTPLRDDYFQPPLLSAKEQSYLVRKACEAAQEVVERARSTQGPMTWRHVEKYNDVQIYTGQSRRSAASSSMGETLCVCGVTTVPATVKEVAALFDLSTSRQMKEFALGNRDYFFDGLVLYTLSPRTRDRPMHLVTAKWCAVQAPSGMAPRDFCYLECQDRFMDSTGRKGWVICQHSIKLPGCDDLTRSFGLVRGSFYHSGMIVVESDRPGHVDIIHMQQLNFKQNTKVPTAFLRERIAFVGRVRIMLRNTRLNEQRYLSDLELVPKKYRSRCGVCQDSFSLLLLRKLNCRKCGEVVCAACSKEFEVTTVKFTPSMQLRICMHCFEQITSTPQVPNAMADAPRHSSAYSLLGYHEDEQRASFMTQSPTSAAEMADRGQQTKIFMQSMSRPRRQKRPTPVNRHDHMGPPARAHDAYRSSHVRHPMRMDTTQQYPFYDDHQAHREMQYSMPPPPPPSSSSSSSASIFDRPKPQRKPQPAPATPFYDFDRQSQYAMNSNLAQTYSDLRPTSANHHHDTYQHTNYDQDIPAPPPRFPPRERKDSASSNSSAESIDLDAFEVTDSEIPLRGGRNDRNERQPSAEASLNARHIRRDEYQRGSMARPSFMSRDQDDETKTADFTESPSFPAQYQQPSRDSLDHDSRPPQRRPKPVRQPIDNASDSEDPYLNTAGCDVNLLDAEMRQFHNKSSLFVNEAPAGTGSDARRSSSRQSDVRSPSGSSSTASRPSSYFPPEQIATSPTKNIDDDFFPQPLQAKYNIGVKREQTFERHSNNGLSRESTSSPRGMEFNIDDDYFPDFPQAQRPGAETYSPLEFDGEDCQQSPPHLTPVDVQPQSVVEFNDEEFEVATKQTTRKMNDRVIPETVNRDSIDASDKFSRSGILSSKMADEWLADDLDLISHGMESTKLIAGTSQNSYDSKSASSEPESAPEPQSSANRNHMERGSSVVVMKLDDVHIDGGNQRHAKPSSHQRAMYQPFGNSILNSLPDDDDNDSTNSEDSADGKQPQSARKMYKKFGSSRKIERLVGGGIQNNPSFRHTLDQIQANIDLMSSDDDAGSGDERLRYQL